MLERLRAILRKAPRTPRPFVEHPKSDAQKELPWSALLGTGNGIGGAPDTIRSIPDLAEEEYEQVYDNLFDHFCHQGTIYAATPFALREVLAVIERADPERQVGLLEWAKACLEAELLGIAEPCYAGVWFPSKDRLKLEVAGITRPSVSQVLKDHQDLFSATTTGPTVRLAKWFVRMHDATPVVFDGINLHESFVRSWGTEDGSFFLAIVASLAKDHPEYVAPPKGQRTCQRDGRIIFEGVTQIDGVAPMQTHVEHTDRWPLDYGPISPFLSNNRGDYYLGGEFGKVHVTGSHPVLTLARRR